ncbi:hypothetical protein PR202_ga25825 [Eleusine coracana subsp. coracana]|uniref:WAT1-related protein n=1 Tax=Eleusine coracana subsp. coracana TaxID=191504 RepID=A0AAV5DAB2_ELECO|nr:hypothetical protein PR202_ga25825 [Eleusine coracana subsp. coracana]
MKMGARNKTPYVVAMVLQVIFATTLVISKVAFDQGLSTFVYIFYRQVVAAAVLLPLAFALERRNAPALSCRILLKMFLYTFMGSTLGMTLYNTSLKYTSATVGSAFGNSVPVVTFFLALMLSLQGRAKMTGMALCLTGVLLIALYAGPSLRPLNRHRVFGSHHNGHDPVTHISRSLWITWTFLMLVACGAWSTWFILQGLLLKEYPNKLVLTLIQCLFGTVQSGLVAVAIDRDLSKWKLGFDLSLLAVAYSGIVGTAICFYLQTWCVDMKGPVFLVMWNPLSLLLTAFCSSLIGETVHLGSILGGIVLVGGLYSMLWGKNKEESQNETDGGQEEDEEVEGKETVEKEATPSHQQV